MSDLSICPRPQAQKDPMLGLCSVVTALTLSIIIGQGSVHFHFVLSHTNHVGGPSPSSVLPGLLLTRLISQFHNSHFLAPTKE